MKMQSAVKFQMKSLHEPAKKSLKAVSITTKSVSARGQSIPRPYSANPQQGPFLHQGRPHCRRGS